MNLSPALAAVSAEALRRNLFHLCEAPLPFRKANLTLPGHAKSTLDAADDAIAAQVESLGLRVVRTPYRVQAFRCDRNKPIHHWYARPEPEDPWYTAHNLEVVIGGREAPDEIIQLVSHKDSMSWIDSPGAHDNCCGTVANLEIIRVLAALPLKRTVRVLFCNEEHTPWTSKFAAAEAAARGDRIIAVLNQDSLDSKSDADMAAGRLLHAVTYSTPEGKPLAERIVHLNESLGIGLEATLVFKERINDDDGMFINAGFRRTVMNLGTFPTADSEYHLPGDRPERVSIENLKRSTQLVLAAVLDLAASGWPE